MKRFEVSTGTKLRVKLLCSSTGQQLRESTIGAALRARTKTFFLLSGMTHLKHLVDKTSVQQFAQCRFYSKTSIAFQAVILDDHRVFSSTLAVNIYKFIVEK